MWEYESERTLLVIVFQYVSQYAHVQNQLPAQNKMVEAYSKLEHAICHGWNEVRALIS